VAEVKQVVVPDIGGVDDVEIIEILVAVGDTVAVDDPLITLESDKASMDIPSPFAGTVKELLCALEDKISEGGAILMMEAEEAAAVSAAPAEKPEPVAAVEAPKPAPVEAPAAPKVAPAKHIANDVNVTPSGEAHASPTIRRFARELGVDLGKVTGSGRKKRILKEDVQSYVKKALASGGSASGGAGLPKPPVVDFSKFGETELLPLSRIKKISGAHLHSCWLNVPHVTQFDEADITDLEIFRKEMKGAAEKQGVKLTFLPFLMKALAHVLLQFPNFNASLDETGENLILKKYCNIGIAVDTPDGLMVPVVRDVDKKGVLELAADLMALSQKARDKKLSPADLQGGCMSISSLGGIGGTAFTPIVNMPEVAILGVSRSSMKPVYDGKEFQPRLMLPLSLSYDHRVIDGALGARFTVALSSVLADMRKALL
jgi:pyruvate dehydrogenase E2 component (dihydrolipoamide acetyltransferase)